MKATLGRWIKIENKSHVFIYTVGATVFSIIISLLITILALSSLLPEALEYPSTYIVSIVAPLIIAPFVSYICFSLILQIEHARQALETISRTDALTQLFNRGFFWERVEQELRDAQAQNQPVAIIIFDVDNFKRFNDQYGHLVGDKVLQLCAQTAAKCMRKNDYLARFGGEEFAAFLKDCSLAEAESVAQRIQQSIAQITYLHEGTQLNITVSLGLVRTQKAGMLEVLAKQADDAMYTAKQLGKNRVVTVTA